MGKYSHHTWLLLIFLYQLSSSSQEYRSKFDLNSVNPSFGAVGRLLLRIAMALDWAARNADSLELLSCEELRKPDQTSARQGWLLL